MKKVYLFEYEDKDGEQEGYILNAWQYETVEKLAKGRGLSIDEYLPVMDSRTRRRLKIEGEGALYG